MVRQIEELLRNLGWADGFHIPVANDENKTLEMQVEKRIKEKGELTIQFEDLTDRVESLLKHSQNVNLEQQHKQAIIIAHKRQAETEESLYQTAQAEQASYEQELRRINKAFQELGERHFTLQNGIIMHTEKLEKLKANVKWDKDALLSWEEEVARGDEDNKLLAKYSEEDESKAKEHELNRLRLCKEAEERNQLVIQIISDVDSLERVLDRTSKLFRKAHTERQDFIVQWEGSVRVLHQRDYDIHSKIQEINMLRTEAKHRLEVEREQKQFYGNEVNNNKEIEVQISSVTRSTIRLRDEYNKLLKIVDELTSELGAMRRMLAATASRLENQRYKNKKIAEEITAKEYRVKELIEVVQNTKKRLEQVTDQTMSAAERARHLEEMIQCEEKSIEVLSQDVGKLNNLLHKTQQELFNLKQQEEQQQIEINTYKCSQSQLICRIQQTEKELLRQQEMVYNKEFESQMIQSRISHLSGTFEDTEKRELYQKKIEDLEKILKEKMSTLNLLTAQNQRLEDKTQGLSRVLNGDSAELQKLKEKRLDKILLTEGGEKQLKIKKTQNQEKQVEENVLRLRVNQAEKAIAHEGDKVYSLEKQKLELEAAMKERQVEIGVHRDVLLVQKRTLNDDKSHLIADIKGCEMKINQLQNKYDIVMSSMGQSEEGEQFSVTYYKIKSAQEKYELQQQGDELDAKIRKAEKEIQAMENTLKIINATNDTYKKNLSAVDEESDEYKEKKELESQYYTVVDTLRHQKSQLSELKNQIEVLEQALQDIFVTEGELRTIWRDKDQEAGDLDRDLREQTAKLQRAEKQLRKTIREVKGMSHSKLTVLEEKDIETRELQEQNQSALQQLAELVARHIEAGPVVIRYLEEKGLCLPISRSPGGSLTYASSKDRLRHTPPVKSPASSRFSFPLGSASSSQLLVPGPSSSHLSVTSQTSQDLARSEASSRSSQRSAQSVASASVITLDPAQLDDAGGAGSSKALCGSAASLKRKPKKE